VLRRHPRLGDERAVLAGLQVGGPAPGEQLDGHLAHVVQRVRELLAGVAQAHHDEP
jgi:hypothetical protein